MLFRKWGDETGYGKLPFLSGDHLQNIAGHAAIGRGSSVAQGGKCGSGALSAGFGSLAGPVIPSNLGRVGNVAVQTVMGETTSVLAGGIFANGAITALFAVMFNECLNAEDCLARSRVIDNIPIPGWIRTVGRTKYIYLQRQSRNIIWQIRKAGKQ